MTPRVPSSVSTFRDVSHVPLGGGFACCRILGVEKGSSKMK